MRKVYSFRLFSFIYCPQLFYMNQFELALQQFKANLKQEESKARKLDVASKYISKTGRYNPHLSEQVRQQYKKSHPKCISASITIKCLERPNHHKAANNLLTKIFSM